MNNFLIYTRDYCPWCVKAKELLESLNLSYSEYKLGRDFQREDFIGKFGEGSTFPRVLVEDSLIGGCTDLAKYIQNNYEA